MYWLSLILRTSIRRSKDIFQRINSCEFLTNSVCSLPKTHLIWSWSDTRIRERWTKWIITSSAETSIFTMKVLLWVAPMRTRLRITRRVPRRPIRSSITIHRMILRICFANSERKPKSNDYVFRNSSATSISWEVAILRASSLDSDWVWRSYLCPMLNSNYSRRHSLHQIRKITFAGENSPIKSTPSSCRNSSKRNRLLSLSLLPQYSTSMVVEGSLIKRLAQLIS